MFQIAGKIATVPLATTLLFWAQMPCFCQTFAERSQVVVTKNDAYFLGPAAMVAPAHVEDIAINPRGRYALIFQKEAALPSGVPSDKPQTGAATLVLYDAKLRKTRTLWERPADGNSHSIEDAKWIPGTDCAVVVTNDTLPLETNPPNGGQAVYKGASAVLLFNFGKSNVAHVLATTTTTLFKVDVSPTKPAFVLQNWEGHQAQLVNALTGAIGPVLPGDAYSELRFPAWSEDGTIIYGAGTLPSKNPSDKFPNLQWFAWDGKSPDVKILPGRPAHSLGTFFDSNLQPPLLPVALRMGALPVPSALPIDAPAQKAPVGAKTEAAPAAVLHPLFLEAAPNALPANGLKTSSLVAPDSDKAYLLADQSAILYQSGGALYAVPLVRMKADAYAAKQKQAQTKP